MKKNTTEICLIAVGYNRPNSMKRLLNSILEADYCNDSVDLIISIDKGERQSEIVEIAEGINWRHGNKEIRAFTEKQGLRNHIIQCGDFAYKYSAIVVLEDDITVSKGFYTYVKQCLDYYGNNEYIGGISLYKQSINLGVGHSFEPEFNGYDCFLMQYAQSWGQCWTSRMWHLFKEWYNKHSSAFFESENNPLLNKMPDNIIEWGENSWLRYYMAYILANDLFFVYPYHSLSTNHSEAGVHNKFPNNDYQVALASENINYRLPSLDEAVKYDIFFERIDYKVSGYDDKRVIFDLYGYKKDFTNADILVSTKPRPYKVLEQFKMKYRPHEVNCLYKELGEGIFVYDLNSTCCTIPKYNKLMRTRYDVRGLSWRKILSLGLYCLKETLLRKMKTKHKS